MLAQTLSSFPVRLLAKSYFSTQELLTNLKPEKLSWEGYYFRLYGTSSKLHSFDMLMIIIFTKLRVIYRF